MPRIWTASVVIGIEPKSAQIGGYRGGCQSRIVAVVARPPDTATSSSRLPTSGRTASSPRTRCPAGSVGGGAAAQISSK